MKNTAPIYLHHNLEASKFMWLWAKYVQGFRDSHHCTNCLLGPYSKKFNGTKHPDLILTPDICMDEEEDFKAVYVCGSRENYILRKKTILIISTLP